MSSLSRSYARASKRGDRLMEQYQPGGVSVAGPGGRKKQIGKVIRRREGSRIAGLSRRGNRRPKMCPKKRGKKHGEEEKKKMTKEDRLELRILFLTKTENRSWRRSGRR